MQFSEKLKKLRADKGVSQSKLAEKIYVSRSAVAKWENGLGLPSEESLTLLAEFFCINKSELLSDPETASVIINKNHTLAKQKLWIIVLVTLSCALIAVAAALIPFALKKSNSPEPTLMRELVFDTEQNIDDLNAKNYSDDSISVDNYYAPTRIFTYTSRTTRVRLPKLLIKSTLGNKISFTEVKVNNVSLSASENCELTYNQDTNYLYITAPNSPYSDKKEYCVNLAVDDLRLSLKVKQESVPVQSIYMYCETNGVLGGIGSRVAVISRISPSDATYQAIGHRVEKIVKSDGSLYDDKLYKYAYFGGFEDDVYLYITPEIELGAKIYIYAEAERDQVRSNVVEIEVVRTPISDIEITSNSLNSITLGATCWFRLNARNEDATFNVLGEQFETTNLTPELAKLEYSKSLNMYFITATDDYSNAFSVITIQVSTPEGYSKTFYWMIDGVKEVNIINADTGEKFERTFSLKKGTTTHFKIEVLPENLKNVKTELHFLNDFYQSEYYTFTQTGKELTLTIFGDTPGGVYIDFYIYVKVDSVNFYKSQMYHITVEKTPVESLTLIPDSITLEKNIPCGFTFEYLPLNADINYERILIYMLNQADGVRVVLVNNNWQVYADYSAVGGTEVKLTAIYENVQSQPVTLTVQEVPVEEVLLGIQTFKVVNRGEIYPLSLSLNKGADAKSIECKLIDEVKGVHITMYLKDYILFVSTDATVGTKFRIQAVVDDIESNILNLEVVDLAETEEIIDLVKDEIYYLNNMLYPNAEPGSVKFVLIEQINNSELLFLYVKEEQQYVIAAAGSYTVTGKVYHVLAIVDGEADKMFTFKVVDPPEKLSATNTIQAEEYKRKHGS